MGSGKGLTSCSTMASGKGLKTGEVMFSWRQLLASELREVDMRIHDFWDCIPICWLFSSSNTKKFGWPEERGGHFSAKAESLTTCTLFYLFPSEKYFHYSCAHVILFSMRRKVNTMKAHGEEALTIPFVGLRSGYMQPQSSPFCGHIEFLSPNPFAGRDFWYINF